MSDAIRRLRELHEQSASERDWERADRLNRALFAEMHRQLPVLLDIAETAYRNAAAYGGTNPITFEHANALARFEEFRHLHRYLEETA